MEQIILDRIAFLRSQAQTCRAMAAEEPADDIVSRPGLLSRAHEMDCRADELETLRQDLVGPIDRKSAILRPMKDLPNNTKVPYLVYWTDGPCVMWKSNDSVGWSAPWSGSLPSGKMKNFWRNDDGSVRAYLLGDTEPLGWLQIPTITQPAEKTDV